MNVLQRNTRWATIGLGLAGLVILVAVVGVSVTLSQDPDAEAIGRGSRIGAARAGSNDDVVIVVNGIPISRAEVEESRAVVQANREFTQALLLSGAPGTEGLKATYDLIEESDVSTVALASVIARAAIEARAITDGHTASDAEVSAFVKNQQAAPEKADARARDTFEAYVAQVGADRYWSEIAPRLAARAIVTEKAYRRIVGGLQPSDGQRAWIEHERSVVETAQIEVADASALGNATEEGALAYLSHYWDIRLAEVSP